MIYSCYSPTEIIAGEGCVLSFRRFSWLGSRCVIITGKNMHKYNSALSDVQTALNNEKIKFCTVTEAENNPSVKSIFSISSDVKAFNADFIIGIGGGSSMDTAKAVSIAAANDDLNEDNFFSVDYNAPSLPVVLIGTTAGTGSEVMPSAVLTVKGDIPIKKSIKTRNSYAEFALCDYTYTLSMPEAIAVSTALDTICHSIEAAYSKKGGEWSKIYGHAALKHTFPALSAFINGNRDNSLRERLYFGSILGGYAINNGGTSFPHSMGYMLTTMHNIHHGFACAVFISEFVSRISEICDVSDTMSACGVNSVDEFMNMIDNILSAYFEKPHIEQSELAKYAELAMQMNVNNNYLNLSFNDCLNIYIHNCGR
ncbi:MAG: iron-containing alcohol dehydrogenase [Clostridia bacterium]|nr:iron-containing alcohol dehydrogenase [Clostridia bacterium]